MTIIEITKRRYNTNGNDNSIRSEQDLCGCLFLLLLLPYFLTMTAQQSSSPRFNMSQPILFPLVESRTSRCQLVVHLKWCYGTSIRCKPNVRPYQFPYRNIPLLPYHYESCAWWSVIPVVILLLLQYGIGSRTTSGAKNDDERRFLGPENHNHPYYMSIMKMIIIIVTCHYCTVIYTRRRYLNELNDDEIRSDCCRK